MKVDALDLEKAMDMQGKMAIKMVEKLKKDYSKLTRTDLVDELDNMRKDHERIVKLLSTELESSVILRKDNTRLTSCNKELVRINEVLTTCYKRAASQSSKLQHENALYRRSYNAFKFFLSNCEMDSSPCTPIGKLLQDLSHKYDPDLDYLIDEKEDEEEQQEEEETKTQYVETNPLSLKEALESLDKVRREEENT